MDSAPAGESLKKYKPYLCGELRAFEVRAAQEIVQNIEKRAAYDTL
jgi:hypothetical protein